MTTEAIKKRGLSLQHRQGWLKKLPIMEQFVRADRPQYQINLRKYGILVWYIVPKERQDIREITVGASRSLAE